MMLRKKLFHFTGVSLLVNVCPGKKDYVSVKTDGVKEYAQKCLLLGNFRELYVNFYEESSDVRKEGFSTSCTLRPKECITCKQLWKPQCLCLSSSSKHKTYGSCCKQAPSLQGPNDITCL